MKAFPAIITVFSIFFLASFASAQPQLFDSMSVYRSTENENHYFGIAIGQVSVYSGQAMSLDYSSGQSVLPLSHDGIQLAAHPACPEDANVFPNAAFTFDLRDERGELAGMFIACIHDNYSYHLCLGDYRDCEAGYGFEEMQRYLSQPL